MKVHWMKKISMLASVGIATAMVLSGCAGGTGASSSESGTSANTSIRIGLTPSPANLNFEQTAGQAIPQALMYNVYESLVKLNENGKTIQPLLAKSWKISNDGLTYTFNLRSGVKFSNGDPFNASTVKFNLERLNQWKANTPANLSAIDHVDAVSNTEAKVVLKEPDRNTLFWLTSVLGAMVDPNEVNNMDTQAIGTGPFTVSDYKVGSQMDLKRNDSYWGTKPALRTAQLKYYSDTTSSSNALLSGDIDAIYNFQGYDQIDQFKNDNYTINTGNAQGDTMLVMNPSKGPFSNIKLRQAVMYAVDKDRILKTVINGYGTVLSAPVIPSDPWYKNLSSTYKHDTAKAKQLVQQSGVKDLTVNFTVPTRPYAQSIAQIVKTELDAIGFKVNLTEQEFPAVWIQNTMTNKNYDMTAMWHVEARNVTNYGNANYYWNYNNAKVNSDFAAAKKAGSDTDFNSSMLDAVTQIQQDAPADWLYNTNLITITKKGITGFSKNDVGIAMDLTGVKG
ncbi:ABC transporter substrate-binding protein [Bifidobacterium aquikefiricola]|uniref:ABC transporter substrate-binding protein n=1 Tax=Bifidobacterium aquikefiricola TaxID=3059038 RepID=A0AB39U7B6_9BIFI